MYMQGTAITILPYHYVATSQSLMQAVSFFFFLVIKRVASFFDFIVDYVVYC